MRRNSPSSFASPRLLPGNKLPRDAVAIRNPPLSTKEIFHRKSGEDLSKERIPALLRGRLRRRLLGGSRRVSGASRRVSGGIWSFRGSRTRHFSRRRRRGRRSWTCRRSDSFSFLLARREKRGSGQNADVFLHSWRSTLLQLSNCSKRSFWTA